MNSAKAMIDKQRVRNKRVTSRDWASVAGLLIMLALALTFMVD